MATTSPMETATSMPRTPPSSPVFGSSVEGKDQTLDSNLLDSLDRVAWAPTKITELTRKGVKRPLEVVIDSLDEERQKKIGRFVESKVQELTMEMKAEELKAVEAKVEVAAEVAVNGPRVPPKTVEFRLWGGKEGKGDSVSCPKEWYTTHLDHHVFFIGLTDGFVQKEKGPGYYSNVSEGTHGKSVPFPAVIKIKNNPTNEKKAQKIRKLVASGHTAKAFLVRSHWSESEGPTSLKLMFGRTPDEDTKYLPVWRQEQAEKKRRLEALQQARAFHDRIRDNPEAVPMAEFESRLTPAKLAEWQTRKEEELRKLMQNFVCRGYSYGGCFNADTWMEPNT
jgi:hypothetical protein